LKTVSQTLLFFFLFDDVLFLQNLETQSFNFDFKYQSHATCQYWACAPLGASLSA
jgi:hypothetical protein